MGDMIRAKEKVKICFNNLSSILMKGKFQICLLTFDLETRNPGGVFLLLSSDYSSLDSRAKPRPYRHDRRADTHSLSAQPSSYEYRTLPSCR